MTVSVPLWWRLVPSVNGELSAIVGTLLRDRIKAARARQVDVAAAGGLSQSQLSRCLSGERRWDLDQFSKVCRYLGTCASDLLSVAEEMLGDG